MTESLLSLFLPVGMLEYFDIIDYKTTNTNQEVFTKYLTIFLEEKNLIPDEYKDCSSTACGFMDVRLIDDYPIRDMLVKLSIKRRRWSILTEGKKQKVSRDWSLVFDGSRMSEDYSAFLKEISRY